tara:strand:- start:1908 stop:2360 length:453 start_codon:yes stop_codon:yes gene_type:complete
MTDNSEDLRNHISMVLIFNGFIYSAVEAAKTTSRYDKILTPALRAKTGLIHKLAKSKTLTDSAKKKIILSFYFYIKEIQQTDNKFLKFAMWVMHEITTDNIEEDKQTVSDADYKELMTMMGLQYKFYDNLMNKGGSMIDQLIEEVLMISV